MLDFWASLSLLEQVLYGVLLFSFLYQLLVWFGYGCISGHRHHSRAREGSPLPSVSVIVLVSDSHMWYLQPGGGLHSLLGQEYAGDWEVVVVNDCGGVELTEELTILSAVYPRLRYTELKKDQKFGHTRKMPLMVGIKSAKYPNLLFTDPVAEVRGSGWLNLMARGFIGGDIVLGYTGFCLSTNNFIRCSRLMSSIRSLSSAISGRPYKGIYSNMGYTSGAFFDARGFTHLNLATGDDDLFVQEISKSHSCSVILNPRCTLEQYPVGGLRWWWWEQRYRTYSHKHYPFSVKFRSFMDMFSKLLFFVSCVWLFCFSVGRSLVLRECMDFGSDWWDVLLLHPGWVVGLCFWLLREFIVLGTVRGICRRLGEKGLVCGFMFYDLLNPFSEFILWASRRLFKVRSINTTIIK